MSEYTAAIGLESFLSDKKRSIAVHCPDKPDRDALQELAFKCGVPWPNNRFELNSSSAPYLFIEWDNRGRAELRQSLLSRFAPLKGKLVTRDQFERALELRGDVSRIPKPKKEWFWTETTKEQSQLIQERCFAAGLTFHSGATYVKDPNRGLLAWKDDDEGCGLYLDKGDASDNTEHVSLIEFCNRLGIQMPEPQPKETMLSLQELRDYAASLIPSMPIDMDSCGNCLSARYCKDKLGFINPSAGYTTVDDRRNEGNTKVSIPEQFGEWNRTSNKDHRAVKNPDDPTRGKKSWFYVRDLVTILDEMIQKR